MIESIQKKPNYLYSIFSVALVLFLLGFFGALMIQTQSIINYFKENVQMIVELKKEVSTSQQDSFKQLIIEKPYVQAGTLEYTDKETAYEEAEADLGDDLKDLGLGNPYYDIISFRLSKDHIEKDQVAAIVSELRSQIEVSDVYYQKGIVDDIGQNLNQIWKVGILISLIFVIVAMGIIYSTIKIAIYSNRFLIKNMQLVGATYDFISRPYLIRSIKHGFISSGIAILLLLIVFVWVDSLVSNWSLLRLDFAMLVFFLFLILVGLSLTVFSTLYTVRKYLKSNIDELH